MIIEEIDKYLDFLERKDIDGLFTYLYGKKGLRNILYHICKETNKDFNKAVAYFEGKKKNLKSWGVLGS